MTYSTLTNTINDAFDVRDSITQDTIGEVRDAVEEALGLLDRGEVRVAETTGNHEWKVNQWLKKAVLLSFRLNPMQVISSGADHNEQGVSAWWDKVPSKFAGWMQKHSLRLDLEQCLDAMLGIQPTSHLL